MLATREVSDSSVSDKPQKPESEWVLGITYLITFDLVMLERKTRIAALREERSNYYDEQRVKKASLELISDCLSSDLYEDWMQMSLTLMAAACIDEHRHKLMLWKRHGKDFVPKATKSRAKNLARHQLMENARKNKKLSYGKKYTRRGEHTHVPHWIGTLH